MHLLKLPGELRDLIYELYLTVQGGYIPNYAIGKLTVADGKAVDLALTYTCKLVVAEMHGLALILILLHSRQSTATRIVRRLGGSPHT